MFRKKLTLLIVPIFCFSLFLSYSKAIESNDNMSKDISVFYKNMPNLALGSQDTFQFYISYPEEYKVRAYVKGNGNLVDYHPDDLLNLASSSLDTVVSGNWIYWYPDINNKDVIDPAQTNCFDLYNMRSGDEAQIIIEVCNNNILINQITLKVVVLGEWGFYLKDYIVQNNKSTVIVKDLADQINTTIK